MSFSQVMAGLQTKRALFAAAAAAAEGGPVAWRVSFQARDGSFAERLWRGPSALAAKGWAQADPDVRVVLDCAPVTLDELRAIEAAMMAAALERKEVLT